MRKTYTEITEIIETAKAAGVIWNVDYQDLKHWASNAFYYEVEDWKDQNVWNVSVDDRTDDHRFLMWDFNSELHLVASKKLAKGIKDRDLEQKFPALKPFMDRWTSVAQDMKELKGLIQKGRKPSTDPRKTPERTLENTGTCGVCGQNVKMRDGRLVQHGYKVVWNQFQGNCFGVGHEPVEVSPQVLIDYKAALVSLLQDTQAKLARFEAEERPLTVKRMRKTITLNPGDQGYDYERGNIIRSKTRMIEMVQTDITQLGNRITNWVATPLPK